MAPGSVMPPAEEPRQSSAGPPTDDQSSAGAVGEPPRGEERYGPLAVLRTHKDDGRSLILYSRAEGGRADGETPPANGSPEASA